MVIFEEELLEPLARAARFSKGLAQIKTKKALRIVDLGCGPKIRLFYAARKRGLRIKSYTGVDPLIQKLEIGSRSKKIKLLTNPLNKKIPLPSQSADLVTGFAFLEHIDHPKEILNETLRILAPGGQAIFTTPTHRAKAILEFLSYRLGIIARREIEEHKNYFSQKDLLALVKKSKLYTIEHHYFECGCNNVLVIKTAK